MNECDRVSDLFGEFSEKRLDKQTETYVDDHLSGCQYCHRDYQWYGLTVKTLTNLERLNPPDHLLEQIKEKLHETNQPESISHFLRNFFASSPYMPLPVGVGALVLIVFIGVIIYDRSPHEVFSKGTQTIAQSKASIPSAPVRTDVSSQSWAQTHTKGSPLDSVISKGVFGDGRGFRGHLQQYAMSSPRMLEADNPRKMMPVPFAQAINGNNLTVESKSIPVAVDSFKRMLPSLEGSLLEEKTEDRVGEIILGVAIPSSAYNKLTSELVNFGSLASGSTSGPPSPVHPTRDGKQVVLYIRFVPSR